MSPIDQPATAMITERITASVEVKRQPLNTEKLLATPEAVQGCVSKAFREGGKVLFCGNGRSAADAQHLKQFSGRFYNNRPPLYAGALHCNTSYLTAVANDFSFADVYARMVEATGRPVDILIGLYTSGNSENVLRAIVQARMKEMITIGLTGEGGGRMKNLPLPGQRPFPGYAPHPECSYDDRSHHLRGGRSGFVLRHMSRWFVRFVPPRPHLLSKEFHILPHHERVQGLIAKA